MQNYRILFLYYACILHTFVHAQTFSGHICMYVAVFLHTTSHPSLCHEGINTSVLGIPSSSFDSKFVGKFRNIYANDGCVATVHVVKRMRCFSHPVNWVVWRNYTCMYRWMDRTKGFQRCRGDYANSNVYINIGKMCRIGLAFLESIW